MPLGFTSGRPFTPLSVATSAFSSATARLRASFSASSRSAKASSSPRGRLERGIFAGADMPGKGRVRASPAQPRQLTSARPFVPRTGVPEREQFAVWRDEWQVPFGIRPEREGPAVAPFKGTVVTRRVGSAVHTRARSDAHTAVRGRAEIARRGWDAYVLYREAGGGAWFDRGGREFVAEAGDLTISDPTLPYATRAPEGFAFDFWV